jgi:hypothetical protein
MAAKGFKRIGFLTPIGILIFLFVLVNVILNLGNQSLRLQITENQQYITQSMQLEGLHREIVLTLATIAMRDNDPQLKSLLASQGIDLDGPKEPAGEGK